jgi:hypothetical protein
VGSAEEWSAAFARDGYVEFRLSVIRVVRTLGVIVAVVAATGWMVFGGMGALGVILGLPALIMIVFLALVPHLEGATAKGPLVRVDHQGVRLSRWVPLHIPWSSISGFAVHHASERQRNLVVHVPSDFFEDYRRSLATPLRQVDAVYASFIGSAFSVPSTMVDGPEEVAWWLERELTRRLTVPEEILIAPGGDGWPVWDARRERVVERSLLPLSHVLQSELEGFARGHAAAARDNDGAASSEAERAALVAESRRLAARVQAEVGDGIRVYAIDE